MKLSKIIAPLVMGAGILGLGYSAYNGIHYSNRAREIASQPLVVQYIDLAKKVREAEMTLKTGRGLKNSDCESPAEYYHKLKQELDTFEKREDYAKLYQAYAAEMKESNKNLLYFFLMMFPLIGGEVATLRAYEKD